MHRFFGVGLVALAFFATTGSCAQGEELADTAGTGSSRTPPGPEMTGPMGAGGLAGSTGSTGTQTSGTSGSTGSTSSSTTSSSTTASSTVGSGGNAGSTGQGGRGGASGAGTGGAAVRRGWAALLVPVRDRVARRAVAVRAVEALPATARVVAAAARAHRRTPTRSAPLFGWVSRFRAVVTTGRARTSTATTAGHRAASRVALGVPGAWFGRTTVPVARIRAVNPKKLLPLPLTMTPPA